MTRTMLQIQKKWRPAHDLWSFLLHGTSIDQQKQTDRGFACVSFVMLKCLSLDSISMRFNRIVHTLKHDEIGALCTQEILRHACLTLSHCLVELLLYFRIYTHHTYGLAPHPCTQAQLSQKGTSSLYALLSSNWQIYTPFKFQSTPKLARAKGRKEIKTSQA
jgi:hypothetical protein